MHHRHKVAIRVVMLRKIAVRDFRLLPHIWTRSHDILTIGWFGGGRPSQQQPQVVYQQAPAPPKKSGMGMGTAIAAGAHDRGFIVPELSYSSDL